MLGPTVVFGHSVGATARELAGDRAGAMEELEAKWLKLEAARTRPTDQRAMGAAYHLALFHCDDGHWDEVERCLAYAAEEGDARPSADRLAGKAWLASHRGDHSEALVLAREALEKSETSDALNSRARILEVTAIVARAAGNDAKADAAIDAAIALYEKKGNVAATERLRPATRV